MPRVRWKIKPTAIDEFDRESQYTPYTGPTPPNGVYQFSIKQLKYCADTKEAPEQLRVGLELVPRKSRSDERAYKGYFIMAFLNVMEKTAFLYVPFCDAIGVSGKDFCERTIADEDGNVSKIGRWRQDGQTIIMAQIQDKTYQGVTRKNVTWMGPFEEDTSDEDEFDDEDEYADDVIDDGDDDVDEDEPF